MGKANREREIYKVTIVGSVVNLVLMVFKFIAGVVGHSAAMIADAVHSLSDFITDIIVIMFVRVSSKPADSSHSYGHGKYETLATAIIGLVLLGVAIGIFWGGVKDVYAVYNGATLQAPGMVAFVATIVSIVFKEGLYRYTVIKGQSLQSQAVIANAWHHRSDAFSSIGTLLGIGGAIFLGAKWRVLDPLAAIVVSVFIAKVAMSIMKNSAQELLEHSLPEELETEITQIILSVEGVEAPHNLRTRRIGNGVAIEFHMRMDGTLSLAAAHQATSVIEQRLKVRFGSNTHVIIHAEPIRP